MISESIANILILSFNPKTKDYIKSLLEGESYQVYQCNNEANLPREVADRKINLILLEFNVSSTIETCKKIRANFTLRHIPIVLLVEHEDTINKIKGIYAGADDYVEKPVRAGDLLTRIKANLWRVDRDLDANPLTKLPGNASILKELEKRIKGEGKFCMGYVDLDKFKEYNDYYGFELGDKVIQHTADIISAALGDLGTQRDFLGHIGGDDFIFITEWECIESVCERIMESFEEATHSFYKEDDLKRGYIIVKNREGKVTASSILSISIGVATNQKRPLTHVGQIIQIATELKGYAKTFAKNIYIIDRRKI